MFKKILVALDGSKCSQLVLPAAIEVARKFDSEVLVLRVREQDGGRAMRLFADAVATVRKAGISATGELREVAAGHVAKAIVEAAEANATDLIVMGSRGLSDVQALMLGSVTHKVMQTANIPVLVVRPSSNVGLAANSDAVTAQAVPQQPGQLAA